MVANRSRSKHARRVKELIAASVILFLIAALIVSWWSVNRFKDLGDAVNWIHQRSDRVNACVNENMNKPGNWLQNVVNANNCIFSTAVIPSSGSSSGTPPTGDNSSIDASAVLATLNSIKVAPAQNVKYVRSQWKHWSDLTGNGCDTREDVLIASGENVQTDPKTCKVLSGTWHEQYTPQVFTDPNKMDLDHVVPLAWAAANGGNDWDLNKKEQFANDQGNLILASASENRKKGDKGPSGYLPPNEAFQCTYVTHFVNTVAKWGLTIPQADKDAAESVLKRMC